MRVTALVSILIIGVCIALVAWLSMASDIYRSGDFDRASIDMPNCVGKALVNQYPKVDFLMMDLSNGVTMSGPTSPGKAAFAWTMTTKSTGSGSHVDLRNKDATPYQIEEAWHLIEWCGKQNVNY